MHSQQWILEERKCQISRLFSSELKNKTYESKLCYCKIMIGFASFAKNAQLLPSSKIWDAIYPIDLKRAENRFNSRYIWEC